MKKAFLAGIAALSLVGAFMLAGCISSSTMYTIDVATVETTDKTISIKLDSNPTTGYGWTAQQTGDGLIYKSDSYVASSKGNTTGGGGVHTFVYEGQKAGTTNITFTYARSWEENSADNMTVDLEVTTDASGKITFSKTICSDGSSGYAK